MSLTLYSFRYSIYARIVRMALHVRGLEASIVETDPFSDEPAPGFAALSPFGKVPVLDHDGFVLTETAAITRYLARGFAGVPLIPEDPRAEARMTQIIAVLDAQGYWPMVRQVYSHAVFQPAMGEDADPDLVEDGLADAAPVLALLERIAAEGLVLNGPLTLADLHLAPMLGAFAAAPQAADAMAAHPALAGWLDRIRDLPAWRETDPGLATAPARR